MKQAPVAIVLHGGAGNRPAFPGARSFLRELLSRLLEGEGGEEALSLACYAVTQMEQSRLFNAGKGSVRQADGRRRLDASVMEGRLGAFGGVAGLSATWNAVGVAARVLSSTHLLLCGEGANRFARAHRFPSPGWKRSNQQAASGTVGAVVLDAKRSLAAATSTGGLKGALPGRVGDSALLGCGTYADRHAAISCSGRGEDMIRTLLAFQAARFCAQGLDARQAARAALRLLNRYRGRGGLILVTRRGQAAAAFNTRHMSVVGYPGGEDGGFLSCP